MWNKLEGKLSRHVIENARAVAVMYNDNTVSIKDRSKDLLHLYDMSKLVKKYKVIL